MFGRFRSSDSGLVPNGAPPVVVMLVGMALGLAVGACGQSEREDQGSVNVDTNERRQSLDFSGMKLGEGFNAALRDKNAPPDVQHGEPTGNVCIRKDVSSKIPRRSGMYGATSFYVYTSDDVERELRDNAKGRFDLGKTDKSTLVDHYMNHYDFSTPKTILSILVDVTTLRRKARPEPSEGMSTPDNICDPVDPNRPQSFEEFIDKCGMSYLKKRTKGGYILFTAEVGDLSRDEKNALDRAAAVGNGPESAVKPKVVMNDIEKNLSVDVTFDVSTTIDSWRPKHASSWSANAWPGWKAQNLPDLLDEKTERFDPSRWSDYVYFLRKFDSDRNDDHDGYLVDFRDSSSIEGSQKNAYNPRHPRYGDKKTQTYSRYYQDDLEACGVTSVAFDQYKCYADFSLKNQWLLDSNESPVGKLAERARWKLNHPRRVRWASDASDTKDAYRDAVDTYDECLKGSSTELTTLEEHRRQCQKTFRNGNYSALCGECLLDPQQDECSQIHLKRMFNGLPTSPIVAPVAEGIPGASNRMKTVTQEGGVSGTIASKSKYICGLTRIQGGFSGPSETVRLTSKSRHWTLRTNTKLDLIRAAATCAEREVFFDTGASKWLPTRNHKVSLTTTGSDESILKDDRYATALAGLSGNMAGGGDFGAHEKQPGKDKLYVHSDQGAMEAYAVSFGLEAPRYSLPRGFGVKASVSTGGGDGGKDVEQLDFAADEGICFLTKVGGEFDGGGEYARVFRRDEHWHIGVRAACEGCSLNNLGECFRPDTCDSYKKVEARARCYHFDQQN